MTTDTQDQTEVSEAPYMIETIDQFGELMMAWHQNGVDTVKHLIDAPEGIEVVIEDDESFRLEGDIRRGFILGLNMALNFLGKLPFSVTNEDEQTTH